MYFKPLTKDPIRLEYKAEIDKELIENSSTIISRSNYDMSSVAYRTPGVSYKNLDAQLRVSDNIGYYVWFKLQNYIKDELYNLFHYYDDTNSLGWKADIVNDDIVFTANTTEYRYHLKGNPTNDVVASVKDVVTLFDFKSLKDLVTDSVVVLRNSWAVVTSTVFC